MGLFSSKTKREIVCCGLDNGGKTTIVNKLLPEQKQSSQIEATIGYEVQRCSVGKVGLTVFDLGGAKKFRNMWEFFYQDVQGILFVIDSSDRARMRIVKDELELISHHKHLGGLPILVLANKMDLPNCMQPEEIVESLEMTEVLADRPYHITATNALTGEGIDDGIAWLSAKVAAVKIAKKN